MEDTKIQWHAAFVSAMVWSWRRTGRIWYTIRNTNLNTKPLEVDLLVIKEGAGRTDYKMK